MQDRTYLLARIAATKAQIDAYEGAVLAFGTDGVIQSYELDTGQSKQRVTRAQLKDMNVLLDSLYNRLATLEARLYGGATTGVPNW